MSYLELHGVTKTEWLFLAHVADARQRCNVA